MVKEMTDKQNIVFDEQLNCQDTTKYVLLG